MELIRWIRWLTTGAVVLLAIGAFLFSKAVDDADEALAQVMRYDVAWAGMNGRFEALQFERYVARYIAEGELNHARQARLFYEILLGRLETWSSGHFGAFIAANPTLGRDVAMVRAGLQDIAPLVARIEDPEASRAVLAAMAGLGRPLMRVGTETYTKSVVEIAHIRDELYRRQSRQQTLIVGLFAGGFVLIALLWLQNRMLSRSRGEAQSHADSLAHLARYDPLTGLLNRFGFADALATIGHQERRAPICAAIAIDLDGFKGINDCMGHGAGDGLLVSVARRLEETVASRHAGSLVARLGGDEFVVLVTGGCSLEAIARTAEDLRAALREPHALAEGRVSIDATIGFAVKSSGRTEASQIVEDADLALTQAKTEEKGSILAFCPRMRDAAARRLMLEQQLDEALRCGDVHPVYQPQVDVATGTVVGVEALARWRHPVKGTIAPAEFIPVAEASGQIVALGETVIALACRDAARLPAHVGVSINLSVAQLVRETLPERIAEMLARHGLKASRVTLEVTESVVMKDADRALGALHRLKALGVRIALDDFGTGYSALAYLRLFPWDELKIDRSFVRDLATNTSSGAIIAAIVHMARELGIAVVAEGVETHEQQAVLSAAGCRVVQGYLHSRPLALSDVLPLIVQSSSAATHAAS